MNTENTEFVEAVLCPGPFGSGYSWAMMRADGTGKQSATFKSEAAAYAALRKRWPNIKTSEDF